jgi:predicted phage-related endonuclease
MNKQILRLADSIGRRSFIGGSDARIIMGNDEAALIRLWREKRGEAEPEDLSGTLLCRSEGPRRSSIASGFERNTGRRIRDVTLRQAFGDSMDGRHPGRHRGRHGSRVRG